MEDNFEFEKSKGEKKEFIDRHKGKTPNNFIFAQDNGLVLSVGARTDEYLKANGYEYTPYQTRWTPDFMDSIISLTDEKL